jgi:hypothetical protein
MKRLHSLAAAGTLTLSLFAAPFAAHGAPTDTTIGGRTAVALAGSFLSALQGLGVKPGPIGPGQIEEHEGTVFAVFPITSGAVDLGTVHGEIDHAGGLSLTAGTTRVDLTDFDIDLYSTGTPVLTGLVTANGSFVGRLPLFDLSLASATVSAKEDILKVNGVALTLDPAAAAALSGVFGTTVPASIAIGTANVRAELEGYRHWWW